MNKRLTQVVHLYSPIYHILAENNAIIAANRRKIGVFIDVTQCWGCDQIGAGVALTIVDKHNEYIYGRKINLYEGNYKYVRGIAMAFIQ